MAEQLVGRSRELLEAPNHCFVATLRRDGSIHVAPVWVDVDGDTILLNSALGRAWPANLARDPRVTLTVANRDDPSEYVSIRGRLVEQTTDGADAHIDALAKKYTGADVYPLHSEDEQRIVLRIEPEAIHHRT
jgi:PPOX class probable F420-dependent enzyme